MDAFYVTPLGPASLSAISALKAVQSGLINGPQDTKPSTLTTPAKISTLTAPDLAQGLFQQALQAATLSPVADSTTAGASLALQATTSLLASLNAPQAPAATTATLDTTTNPVSQATTASTAPTAATPATPVATDIPAIQDTFATSSSADFAMQTALRFGAGVAGQVAPPTQLTSPGSGLVRDATAVLRTGALQAHAGSPGPEAFTRPQTSTSGAQRGYETVLAPPSSGGLDLMA